MSSLGRTHRDDCGLSCPVDCESADHPHHSRPDTPDRRNTRHRRLGKELPGGSAHHGPDGLLPFVRGIHQPRVAQTLRSPAVQRLRNEFSSLRSAGKLDDPAAVSEAVARSTDAGIAAATRSIEVPGPAGARVLAVYKKPGEIVHRGERIALVQLNGREVPITSKVDGIMQEINISKGGVLANRPRSSAQHRKRSSVRIALITPFTAR